MVTFLFFHHTFLVTLLSNIWGTCQGEVAHLEEEILRLQQEKDELQRRLKESEAETQRITELHNESLLKKRGVATINLGQLRQLYGLGDDGTRRSYRPDR